MNQYGIHDSNKGGLWKISKGDFGLKRLIQSGLIVMTLLLGGCTTNVEEGEKTKETTYLWPETPAFKDDFTREFMDSTEEVQEGYYRFKSKTEGYTMLFPVNARVDAVSYGISHDVYEAYIFGEKIEEENLLYDYQITYENKPATNNIEVNLDLLSHSMLVIKEKYEKFEHEGKTFYYAKDVFATEVRDHYSFFSYIKSNKSDKAISYSASSTCLKLE